MTDPATPSPASVLAELEALSDPYVKVSPSQIKAILPRLRAVLAQQETEKQQAWREMAQRKAPMIPSDRALGSTASNNEPVRPFQSCQCPAAHGEDCPLTVEECQVRTEDYIGLPWFGARLRRIWDGFVLESLNGGVCSIPDTGLNTSPHRTWCLRCQRRYMELKALVEMLDSPRTVGAVDPVLASSHEPSTREQDSSKPDSPDLVPPEPAR